MNGFRSAGAVLLPLALLSACSSMPLKRSAPAAETVEAEGWAPVDSNDLAGTRDRALAEAQKRAVERVLGVFVAASTRVEAAIAISRKIATDTRGRIERYDVLDEKTEAGFVKIRIRALVLRGEAGARESPSTPPSGTPRVEVLIVGDDSRTASWNEAALEALRERFADHGYTLATDALGAGGQAPFLLVRGEVRAVPVDDARLGEFKSMHAVVAIRVTDSRSGGVILEKSGEASALDLDAESAAESAAAGAGAAAGDSAAAELTADLWKSL